jgi:hypothetical protein
MRPALLLALLALPAALRAAPTPAELREARRRFDRANQFYQAGQYADALRLYEASYQLVPSRDILFNLGLAREKVSDNEGCALAFGEYLRGEEVIARRDQAVELLERCRGRTRVPIKITSVPPTAAIWIGEGEHRSLRGRTPGSIELAPGHYTLSLDAPGYVPQTQPLVVEEGARPEVDFQLEKLSALRIEADVAGAQVKIDGVLEGDAPLVRERRAGTYHVEVEKPGYRAVRREVRVNAGDQVSLVTTLPPLPVERRVALELAPGPTGAAVTLDGDALGEPPLVRTATAGPHHIEVTALGHRPYAGDVLLLADRDLRLRVRLAPERTRLGRAVVGTLLGGAGVALIVGGAGGIVALLDPGRFDAQPSVMLADVARGHALAADVSLAVAGGLALASLVYYLATLPGRSEVEIVR